VQGERRAAGNTDLDSADQGGLRAGAERLPEEVIGDGQPGQVTVQVDGTAWATAGLAPTGERGLGGGLTVLSLERMEPLKQLGEAKRRQDPLGRAELGCGNEQVAVGIGTPASRIQPPGD